MIKGEGDCPLSDIIGIFAARKAKYRFKNENKSGENA
jgi:hypothetical protein